MDAIFGRSEGPELFPPYSDNTFLDQTDSELTKDILSSYSQETMYRDILKELI